MAGPCTLLAQPHYDRYIDVDGEHAMPWIASPAIGSPITFEAMATGIYYGIDTSLPPVAFSRHMGFDDYAKNYVAPSAPLSNTGSPAGLTVSNGTASTLNFGGAFTYNDIFQPEGSQGFLAIDGITAAWGFQAYGAANFDSGILLTATGADLSATRQTLAGKSTRGALFIIVYNGANAPRTFQMIRGGVNFGPPRVIPAKTMASIGLGDNSGFAAAQAVGFKVTNSASGDKFFLGWIGCAQGSWSDDLCPIPFRDAFPSTAIANDLSGIGPITTWAGTPRQSAASEGERHWRVPLNRSHIGPKHGTIASRFLPFGWPDGPSAGGFSISRMGQSAYDYASPYLTVTLGVHRYFSGSSSYDPSTSGLFWDLSWYSLYPTASGLAAIDGLINGPTIETPYSLDAPPRQFMTGVVTYDKTGNVSCDVDGVSIYSGTRDGHGTIASDDFPFNYTDPETDDDPLYLYAGYPQDWWQSSVTYSRDVAIFNRPLTTAESAYINDPDSVWSFNMFAEPSTATVTGLDASVYQGDTETLTVTIRDAAGDTVPLYGGRVSITAKLAADRKKSGDVSARLRGVFECGNDGVSGVDSENVLSADPGNGAVSFSVTMPTINPGPGRPPSDAHTLIYDVQFVDVNGIVSTLLTDEFTVHIDVTNDTN